MRQIPFSPPHIDQQTIDAVVDALKSGWITTGPKVRELERQIGLYCHSNSVLCLNSWTNAAELALRWFGVGPGDEVIVPAYTYAATANIVCHLGASPVLIDSDNEDFSLDLQALSSKITQATKVIMAVDIGGMPMDYDAINHIAAQHSHLFQPRSNEQKLLGRMMILSDAAHSFGATYKSAKCGCQTDVMGFSFHAVKNLTTAEGGAITFQLPAPFDNADIRARINISALHGQTKDALSKTQAGQWQYDIVEAGYKCNLTDVHAAIGLAGMKTYDSETIPRRKEICLIYQDYFKSFSWAKLPVFENEISESSYHLYMLRIRGISEYQRNEIIAGCARDGVATNVHFQPLPRLSFYKNLGFRETDFPNAMKHFSSEISLPVYVDLTMEDQQYVMESVKKNVEAVLTGQMCHD
jgi:dTDP-4-amino-4,6-dideoxygalactose transaminase